MEKYVSILSPYDEWIKYASKDYHTAAQLAREEIKNNGYRSDKANDRLIEALSRGDAQDLQDAIELNDELLRQMPIQENYILNKIRFIYNSGNIKEAINTAHIYCKLQPSQKLANELAYLYSLDDDIDRLLQLANRPEFNGPEVINKFFIDSGRFYDLSCREFTKKISKDSPLIPTAVKLLNMCGEYSLADTLEKSFLECNKPAKLPQFLPKKHFLYMPPIGRKPCDSPLLIIFPAFTKRVTKSHYANYGIDKLDLLEPLFEGVNFFSSNFKHLNLLFIGDPWQSWLQLNLHEYYMGIKSIIKNINPTHVITWGPSAGGFASILFGALLNADLSIANSPQTVAFSCYMTTYDYALDNTFFLSMSPYANLNRVLSKIKNTVFNLHYSQDIITDVFQIDMLSNQENIHKIPHKTNGVHCLAWVLGKKFYIDQIKHEANKYLNITID